MEITGDIVEEVIKDFVGRSGRRPDGILFQDLLAIIAKKFIRENSINRKPRKTNFSGIKIYGSDTFPENLAAGFVIHNQKPYGFVYHIGVNNKRGVAKILNAKGAFPSLRLPADMIEINE